MNFDGARNGRRPTQTRVALAVVAALALLAGACGDDKSASDNSQGSVATTPTATVAATTTTLAPQSGGSLTIGLFAATNGFDPANSTVAGSTNGMEMAALYGTLLRYDSETATYQGGMAASIEKNADFTQWTIRLRPGVKFSDGTAYDAAAVKLNIERHMTTASRSTAKPALLQFVDSITAADAQTVVIKLKQAWAGFPFLLTVGPGLIASPAAIEKAGAGFAAAPGDAGAGPFLLSSFKAGDAAVFKKNPNYFGAPVYLDELRFVQIGAPDQTYIALKNNTIQAAYLRDPVAQAEAKKDGFLSVLIASPGGNIALMNSGVEVTCAGGNPAAWCAGKPDGTKVITTPPTSNPKVRQAISYAIDRTVVNQRVWNGTAVVGAQLIDKSSVYYSDVAFPDYNPTEAKRLVQEAKAAGWNGTLKVLTDATNLTWGITIKSLLEAVGITVDLDTSKALSAVITQVAANKDYEMASWGSGMDTSDADYFFTSTNFSSTGRYGLRSTGFDSALDKLRLASNLDEKKAGYKALSEAWARDLPAIPIATIYQGVVHNKNLHGLAQTGGGIVSFEKAWLAK
jgi:peptide/nickel transport system substrate-binding protein